MNQITTFANEISGVSMLAFADNLVGQVLEDRETPGEPLMQGNLEYVPVVRQTGEDDASWNIRLGAMVATVRGQILANTRESIDGAVALHVKAIVDNRLFVAVKDGSKGVRGAVRTMLSDQRIIDAWGDEEASRLLTVLVDTLPQIEMYVDQYPECKISDEAVGRILNKGTVNTPVLVRKAYDATLHARRNGGMTPELACTLAKHINNDTASIKQMGDDLAQLGVKDHRKPMFVPSARLMLITRRVTDPETGEITEQPGAEIIISPDMSYSMRAVVFQAVKSYKIKVVVECEGSEEIARAERELGEILDLRHDYADPHAHS